MNQSDSIRNIAIIAHVDHGKTTLVDGLLKQSNTFRDNQAEMSQELIMDSGDQEKERGITITAKITAVDYNDYRINIIDTPGHADFSGEVERTLRMADGCILVVDAQEGPMPQTKFVLKKALEIGLTPIVVINKIDKPARRIQEVKDELDNLFLELAINEEQLHYAVYYAIGRDGKAWREIPDNPDSSEADLSVIFDSIITDVSPPQVDAEGTLQLLVTSLRSDSFQGKYSVGRIERGVLTKGQHVTLCSDGGQKPTKIDKIYRTVGLANIEVDNAVAGDIVAVTGIADAKIGDTIADQDAPEALPTIEVESPTLRIYIGPNTSPVKGTEGKFTTSRQISDRLHKELETNVGLTIQEEGIGFLVAGRGELHLSVLIETMRREGFEFEVGRPQVVTKMVDGVEQEPVEEVSIEVPSEHAGAVQMELGKRKATLIDQTVHGDITKIVYKMPSRALLGARNMLLTATKGTIIMNSLLDSYAPLGKPIDQIRNGVLIAWETGVATPYALQSAEERGELFVGATHKVYAGQIVGQNQRQDDLEVNVCKEKHLTNMRSSSSDGVVQLTPYTDFILEQCIDFIENDELLEVTPENLRLRKRELDHKKRKRAAKE